MPKPILTLILLSLTLSGLAQTPFRLMFYNVENLFDTVDNPDTEDDEFTPEGLRRWTNKRYYTKINHLSKVITSVGEWDSPALIGLCEVENKKALDDLTLYSPLKEQQYRYVLAETDDIRGIRVALLYQRHLFRYIDHQSIRVDIPQKTRTILHVSGEVLSRDTLDVFVCHFPSRRDGQLESEPHRIKAAATLRTCVDSLFMIRKNAQIVIMGDFNDEPHNKSLSKTLNARSPQEEIIAGNLYNLFIPLAKKNPVGSYKFRDQWNFLDQIIVSDNLMNPDKPLFALPESAVIFQAPYILTEDKTQGGKRPKKTYHGYRYEGGYSDHLPVVVDFIVK